MVPRDVEHIITPQIILYEGFKSKPYIAPEGNWTYGFGFLFDTHGNRVTAHTPPISQADALILLSKLIQKAITDISSAIHVPLTTGQMAALVDFVFNFGLAKLLGSTLCHDINAKNYAGVLDEFPRWIHYTDTHGKSQESTWLKQRRAMECKLWVQ